MSRCRKPQLEMLQKENKAFGGDLFTTRRGRRGCRPLATTSTMHLTLRSSKAVRDWSFKRPNNEKKIREILAKFSKKYGIKILSAANVGNHLHLHFKLGSRQTYKPFIRAITSAIALAVTGLNRWTKLSAAVRAEGEFSSTSSTRLKFWDRRPFTRVVQSFRDFLNLRDYIRINVLEGYRVDRQQARLIVRAGVFVNTG